MRRDLTRAPEITAEKYYYVKASARFYTSRKVAIAFKYWYLPNAQVIHEAL